ncbi:MAG: MFS transporter [Bryobacterales bacterium]|nr:MFS transporter [Bryobacterales bacterium]
MPTNLSDAAAIGARMDRLPATRAVWKLVALISLGGYFEFYDLFLTGYIAPTLVRSGILTPTTRGLFGTTGVASFVAAMFSGLFLGTALFGFVADRFGRRTIFTFSLLWYTAASVVMAFQTDVFGLNLWRFLSGIGVGVELVTIATYISELVPKEMRGRAFAFNQTVQFSSVPTVALLAWLLVEKAPLGLDGWRWVVLAGAAGAAVVWWIRLGLPESPRWLAEHGRLEEAERVVSELEKKVALEAESALPGVSQAEIPPVAVSEAAPPAGRASFAELWNRTYRSRTLMLVVFNIFQTVGFYGFSNWVPTLLIRRGIPITSSLEYTFFIAMAAPFGPLLAYRFADKIERKWQIVMAAASVAFFGVWFGQMSAAPVLIALGMMLTISNNILSYSLHTYQAELYPTRIRALGVGFVYSWSRLSVVFSAFAIAFILERFGVPGVFVFIAGSMAVVVVVIGCFGPRTNQLSLETISK